MYIASFKFLECSKRIIISTLSCEEDLWHLNQNKIFKKPFLQYFSKILSNNINFDMDFKILKNMERKKERKEKCNLYLLF